MRSFLAVAVGKTARFLLRRIRRGGGSALPGGIASRIDPALLDKAIARATLGLVVVSGSAGKSTTTKLLVELLRAHGLKVFTNPSTANIKQGLYAAVLQFSNWRGQIDADIVVMEWDEGHGAALAKDFKPRLAILTNVLSDQLDRFIDPEVVAEKLQQIHDAAQMVVLNSDDKNLCQFADPAKSIGFGLSESVDYQVSYALNFGDHPSINKGVVVTPGVSQASFEIDGESLSTPQQFESAPQALNVGAALLALSKLITPDWSVVRRVLADPPKVFARDELVALRGREVRLMLVQNPTSFQLNLEALTGNETPLMLMAGGDIHDPSWLWQLDFRKLKYVDVVGGRNAHELALVLQYQNVPYGALETEASEASETFLKLEGATPTILFSADAMRRTRRYLGLAK
jgi:lipid II isoglutaminyl synthase (glutamine-hydrolysing)